MQRCITTELLNTLLLMSIILNFDNKTIAQPQSCE